MGIFVAFNVTACYISAIETFARFVKNERAGLAYEKRFSRAYPLLPAHG